MKFISRQYEKGDEKSLNKLYKLISTIDRSSSEYMWEWVNTWDGCGSIWIMLDKDRSPDDQLACHYGLIPVPISFFGQSLFAGKTENCMSHPDYRGKKIYFPHEKKYFEEAKSRFQIFFTTTGKGAPGAIRRKLGYIALDYGVEYFHFSNFRNTQSYIWNNFFRKIKKVPNALTFVLEIISYLISFFPFCFFKINKMKKGFIGGEVKIFKSPSAPLDEIESMWNRNKEKYGISVDRSSKFLKWRIDENPYLSHKYLVLYDEATLIGFIIFHKGNDNTYKIIDILAEDKRIDVFHRLLFELMNLSKKEGVKGIKCSSLKENKILKEVFKGRNFLCRDSSLFQKKKKKSKNGKREVENRPFHIFVSENVKGYKKASDASNWYITDLVKEGRQ